MFSDSVYSDKVALLSQNDSFGSLHLFQSNGSKLHQFFYQMIKRHDYFLQVIYHYMIVLCKCSIGISKLFDRCKINDMA